MPKKQSGKKRTQVKDLPRKEKKLSTEEAKKVKGGVMEDPYILIATKTPKPPKIR